MGVQHLWDHLEAARRKKAIVEIANEVDGQESKVRVAVDVSIWLYETKASRGGVNPCLRTLYMRLCKILLMGFEPVFVFDGPNRPQEKRNKHGSRKREATELMQFRSLIIAFGFAIWQAPAEAEAECAAMQKAGFVDVVLTEDVDVVMFGATRVWRKWRAEGNKAAAAPTHLEEYSDIELLTGLNPPAITFVALMSGNDYNPKGIPNFGMETAIQAAKAGYAATMPEIGGDFSLWTEDLNYQLWTNESKVFSKKRPALAIPEDFPDERIYRLLSTPLVSPASAFTSIAAQMEPNILAIISVLQNSLGWNGKQGRIAFLRTFSPGYLTYLIRNTDLDHGYLTTRQNTSIHLVIHASRQDSTTNDTLEYRLAYIPSQIIHTEIADWPVTPYDEVQLLEEEADDIEPSQPPQQPKRKHADWNADEPFRIWIHHHLIETRLPRILKQCQEGKRKSPKRTPQHRRKKENINQHQITQFYKVDTPTKFKAPAYDDKIYNVLSSTPDVYSSSPLPALDVFCKGKQLANDSTPMAAAAAVNNGNRSMRKSPIDLTFSSSPPPHPH